MFKRIASGVLCACIAMSLPRASVADMFTDARNVIGVAIPKADATGFTLHGGTNFQTGATTASTTLFRANATTGGGCGKFDFREGMEQAFKNLPGLFEKLLEAVIHEMPMLALCYVSPTL